MSDYDSPWKEALDLYFEPFLALVLPQVHRQLDWTRGYEMLEKELQQVTPQAEEGRRTVDKLAKVWLTTGEEEWILVHLEVQTQDTSDFAHRMFVYHCRLRDLYRKDVLSVGVLADDRPDWRPSVYATECLGLCRLRFEYPVVKLLDLGEMAEGTNLALNPFRAIVAAHLRALATRRDMNGRAERKIDLIKRLFQSGLNAEEIRKLFRLIDWLLYLPEPLDQVFWHEVKRFQEERKMPFITTPQRIERAEGLAEGLAEGRAEGVQSILLRLTERKFGRVSESDRQLIQTVTDLERLEAAACALLTEESMEQWRQILTGPSRS